MWSSSHFLYPFWAVKRSANEADCNCSVVEVMVRNLRSISLRGAKREPSVVTFEVLIPIIRNCKEIKEGEELVVHWAPSIQQSTDKRKMTSWGDQARAQLAAEKKKRELLCFFASSVEESELRQFFCTELADVS